MSASLEASIIIPVILLCLAILLSIGVKVVEVISIEAICSLRSSLARIHPDHLYHLSSVTEKERVLHQIEISPQSFLELISHARDLLMSVGAQP